jgi:hypothetical protein
MNSSFSIDLPQFFAEPSRDAQIELSPEIQQAILEANRGRRSFHIASQVDLDAMKFRFDAHPDTRVLSDWIAERGAAVNELGVLFWLGAMVMSEWEALPRLTLSEHRKLYGKIARSCSDLSSLLGQTGAEYRRGGGWGMMHPRVLDLLKPGEMDVVRRYEQGVEERGPHEDLASAIPTVDKLLERLEEAANRLAKNGPVHSQRKKHGAARGYFVRRMGELFMQRYEECPTEVLAALSTLALDEVTDKELVAKLLKRASAIAKK